jgi:transposase
MPRDRNLFLSSEDRQRLMKEAGNPANQRRVACWGILLLADGRPRREVARECKVHPVTVARWIARLRKHGIVGLLGQKSVQGRRSKLTETHFEFLRKTALTSPRQLGKPFAKWTLARLARYFSTQTGIGIRGNYLGRVLRNLGVSWSRGADSMGVPGIQEVEVLWFTVVRRKESGSDSFKGHQGYLLAAINLADGHVTSLKVRRRSSLSFAQFLNRLVHQYQKTKTLLIGQRESIKLTREVVRSLESHRETLWLSLLTSSTRPEENRSDFHRAVQFLAGSPSAAISHLRTGVKQIEHLLGL